MTTRIRTLGVLLIAAVLAAASLLAGPAGAETHSTREGLTIDLTASKLSVEKIAPLDSSPLSAQARLSSNVHAALKGVDGKKVKATVEVGYKVGYPVSAPGKATITTHTPDLSLTGGVKLGLKPGADATGISIGDAGVDLGASSTVIPASDIQFEVAAGKIEKVSLAKFALTKPVADVVLSGIEMEVTGAIGPVSVRPFAQITVTTESGVYVYSSYGNTARI